MDTFLITNLKKYSFIPSDLLTDRKDLLWKSLNFKCDQFVINLGSYLSVK